MLRVAGVQHLCETTHLLERIYGRLAMLWAALHILEIVVDVFDQLVGVWRFGVGEARWTISRAWASNIHFYSLSQRARLPVVRVVLLHDSVHEAEELVAIFVGLVHQPVWLGDVWIQFCELQQRGNSLDLLLRAGNL